VPTLQIRFPAGRYHATPWGFHVNEGLLEWPPSPWRLLRSLISCGFAKHHWVEIPPIGKSLLVKLASSSPSYILPEASVAHSRHYMPLGFLKEGREQTTLVFDTWANIGVGILIINWDCHLNDDETKLLTSLVASLGYLGRSESWIEAQLITTPTVPYEFNAFPHKESGNLGPGWEQVSLMAPIPQDEYNSWQQIICSKIREDFPKPIGNKKPTAEMVKNLENAIEPYPLDLPSCLSKDTSWWKQHNWAQPPGSQRILYWRKSNSLQVGVPESYHSHPIKRISTMLLALTTASGNQSALPNCIRTLPQAELFHRAIVSRVGKGNQVHCPEITGKDENGKPLHDHHDHTHTFPLDLDGDGHLDHLLIYAKMGLGENAQQAIRTLRRTWTKGGAGDIQLALVGHGELEILRNLPQPMKQRIDTFLGPKDGARVWESLTPFVPPRFLKSKGKNSLVGQINAELTSRLLPEVEKVEIVPLNNGKNLRHYIRRRSRGGFPPPVDVGYDLKLYFSKPISGPLALGYASHYGLGLFNSIKD